MMDRYPPPPRPTSSRMRRRGHIGATAQPNPEAAWGTSGACARDTNGQSRSPAAPSAQRLTCTNARDLHQSRCHTVHGMQGVTEQGRPAVPGWPIRRPPLCLEAGIAYLVVVGEDGACRCPFGVRRQQRVGRLSGTTALLPSQDKTHQLTNPREHLSPRLGCTGLGSHRESGGASKTTCGSRQAHARPW
jgi:hypothetical protein